MEQEIRFCTTSDGVRIAYALTGRGIPVVRVLGWLTHLEYELQVPFWRSLITAMSQRYLFVRYDGRCTGLSDRDLSKFGVDGFVKDIEAVVDALGSEKVVLYAPSQGGPAAIRYVVQHPERVSHLILYGSFGRYPFSNEQAATMAAVAAQGWGSDIPAHRQFFTGLFMPDGDPEDVRTFTELQRVSATPEAVGTLISLPAEAADVGDLLSEIRVPALVVHQRGDVIVPFEFGRELAAGIPGARLVAVEGRNHAPVDAAVRERMMEAIVAFLEGDEAAQAAPRAAAASGLVTVLFTDMEGSTTMTQRLGDAKAQELMREHNEIVRGALKEHGGDEIKHTGDGFMASFGSPRRALECAAAIQRAFAKRNEDHETPIRVRIGVNAGEPVAEERDLFGSAVQLAARICAAAEPGQVLVPDGVRHLVAGKGFMFSDRGEMVLRGFEDPVRLMELRW